MEALKLVYLLWPPEGTDRPELRKRLLAQCAPALLERGARFLQMNIADEHALVNDGDVADVPPGEGLADLPQRAVAADPTGLPAHQALDVRVDLFAEIAVF